MNFHNKLECLSLASLSSLVYCLWARSGAYPRVEHLKNSSIGLAQALPTNIRLCWKSLLDTNTLAFNMKIRNLWTKMFYNIDNRGQCYKTLLDVIRDENATAHIRHLRRKMTILSCHRLFHFL